MGVPERTSHFAYEDMAALTRRAKRLVARFEDIQSEMADGEEIVIDELWIFKKSIMTTGFRNIEKFLQEAYNALNAHTDGEPYTADTRKSDI